MLDFIMYLYLYIYAYVHKFTVYIFMCIFYLCIYSFIYLYIYLFIYLFIFLFIDLFIFYLYIMVPLILVFCLEADNFFVGFRWPKDIWFQKQTASRFGVSRNATTSPKI